MLERGIEIRVSRRNARWTLARGGVEYGARHYRVMVALHVAFLLAATGEPALLDRPFVPAIGWPALGLALACQAMRWWCVATLGPRWNTRIIVVPGMPRVTSGPYRWLDHPNYLAVLVETVALPLVHTAWITAVVFGIANAALLAHRIRVEETAFAARSSASGR